jgi:hypothetical protein
LPTPTFVWLMKSVMLMKLEKDRREVDQVRADPSVDGGIAHLEVEVAERHRMRRRRRGEQQGGEDRAAAQHERSHPGQALASDGAIGKLWRARIAPLIRQGRGRDGAQVREGHP